MDTGFLLAALIELRANTAAIHDRLLDLEAIVTAELAGRCPHLPADRLSLATFEHDTRYLCRKCGTTSA